MIDKLQKLGFTDKEALIYSVLVKLGPSSANNLAKESYTNRTVTYNVLQNLINKGVISYVLKDNKRVYQISKPDSLFTAIKEKEMIAKDLISDIKMSEIKSHDKKSVQVFEGSDGMKVIFSEIRNSKNLRVINATGLIYEYLKFSTPHILKDIQLHSNAKIIACQSMKKTKLADLEKVQIKYLPKNADNYATTFIYQESIVIQVLKGKPFLIKIENKEIFEGYKKNFDVLWDNL